MIAWEELIPRFVTEECVADFDENGTLRPVMMLEEVEPGEVFDRVVEVNSLAWLGIGFFASFDAPGRPFLPGSDDE